MGRAAQFIFGCLSLVFLTGFHGCLNQKVHLQSHASTTGQRIGYVDTRSGTGGTFWVAGHTSPAVQMPFGMVKLGPDTQTIGRTFGMAGYHYGDVSLSGFSHTRLVGTGALEGGSLRVMPSAQVLTYSELVNYRPTFSHRNETAIPGYYSVTFDSGGIQAEMTATARVGLHRYTFTTTTNPVLYLELTSHLSRGGSVTGITANVDPALDRIQGDFLLKDDFSGRYGGLRTYFDIRLPNAFATYRFITASGDSATMPSGDPTRVFLEMRFTGVAAPEMRTSLSYVSSAGATANMTAEAALGGVTFAAAMASNQASWEALLGRAVADGSNESDLRKYYTALYNSFRMPTLFGDYDAATNQNYTGFDGATHVTAGYAYYSDFSLWDTFRTVHPLYMLIARTEQDAMLRSLLRMAEQSGRFPRWASGGGHADSMLGFPAAITVAESYLKGLTGFGAAGAYTLLKSQATAGSGLGGTECFTSYANDGYCPSDERTQSVSYTLEYAYADKALASFATALGQTADAAAFTTRAGNFNNHWSASHQAFLPKDSTGAFLQNCRLEELSYIGVNPCSKHYVEGSAMQYRWYVPQSPTQLLALFSNPLTELETFFSSAPQSVGTPYPSGYYWHGNEPSLAAITLLNRVSPSRAQYWNAWIQRTKYDTTAIGIDGNDDGGTLSAWFVLSAMGIMPVAGTDVYEIVSPLFDKVTLDIAGNAFEIRSTGASSQGKRYVRSATLNAVALTAPRFTHADIATGGLLVLDMVDSPTEWQ